MKNQKLKHENCENNRGITLIALVVTIIVLLILTGVSLNLVAGSNGILSRASNAVNSMNLAKIKEELELKIAEMQLDYYSDSSLQNSYATVNAYVKAKFKEGIELSNGVEIACDEDGTLNYEGLPIGTLNSDGTITIDGEFNGGQIIAKYKVTYNANGGTGSVPLTAKYDSGATVMVDFSTTPTRERYTFLGWATSSNATTPEYTSSGSFTINQNTTLYAVWGGVSGQGTSVVQPAWYGDTVNYCANSVNDWQVFLNDGSNIYIVSGDLVPSSGMTITSDVKKVDGNDYQITGNSSRDGLVSWLTTTSNWTEYARGINGATATGGPTLDQFVKSYNAKYGTDYSNSTSQDNWTLSNTTDTLYINHTDVYWLASPNLVMNLNLWTVRPDAIVRGTHGYKSFISVRPLVQLPANAKMSWNGSSWDLSN